MFQNTDLRFLAVHVENSQLIIHQLDSHSGERRVLLQLAYGTLDVLHHHMSITKHIQKQNQHEGSIQTACGEESDEHLNKPILPSNSDDMWLLAKEELLKVFNVLNLWKQQLNI